MPLVDTTVGLVDLDKLQVSDIVSYAPAGRVIVTEWRLNGELVRKDLYGNAFSGIEVNVDQGKFE